MPDTLLRGPAIDPLAGSMRDFRELTGTDLLARVEPFFAWKEERRANGFWPYSKSMEEAPRPITAAIDDQGRRVRGVNFASQDYLGLSSHPAIKETAKAVIDEFGVHSAGSSALAGNNKYSAALEATIADFLRMKHTTLYPTGWAAGYGVIKGLVRPDDHVVMDGLAHACLQEGAYSATKNVHLHGHLNLDSTRRHLRRIRNNDAVNGIMVVTESLFSMDSDTPDLLALQDLCREYGATLLVDVAHDLGCIGEDGRGHIGLQHMLGKIDLVMGSFSKTFASNGGFVASQSPSVREYLKFYGCSATFSNALSPVQCATVLKAFEIIQSAEGKALRQTLMDRVLYLRRSLEEAEFKVMGAPSAIVPVVVGPEALARMVCRRLPAQRVVANLVEYPAVAKGNARLRLQAMASHTTENIDDLVAALSLATDAAQSDYRQYCERAQRVQTSQASEIHAPQLHRLLAIDDNIDSAELVVRVARKCGYEAEPLSKQEDLPARLKAAPIDVLTLDLCMPEQDGIRLMSVLQENGFKGQIIIVSGQPGWLRKSAGRLAQARGLSVVADFAKPLDLAAMTQLLQKLQSERRPEAA